MKDNIVIKDMDEKAARGANAGGCFYLRLVVDNRGKPTKSAPKSKSDEPPAASAIYPQMFGRAPSGARITSIDVTRPVRARIWVQALPGQTCFECGVPFDRTHLPTKYLRIFFTGSYEGLQVGICAACDPHAVAARLLREGVLP
jgi:hypothetical protein